MVKARRNSTEEKAERAKARDAEKYRLIKNEEESSSPPRGAGTAAPTKAASDHGEDVEVEALEIEYRSTKLDWQEWFQAHRTQLLVVGATVFVAILLISALASGGTSHVGGPGTVRTPTEELELPPDFQFSWKKYVNHLRNEFEADEAKLPYPDMWKNDKHHSFDEMVMFLWWINKHHKNITNLYSIGGSVQKKGLWVMQICSHSGLSSTRLQPEVRIVGNIHGDEPANMEILLRLIHLLTTKYGTDDAITELVDNTCIHILPSLNPDGMSAKPRKRNNANGVDLNRNFPVLGLDGQPPNTSDTDALTQWHKYGGQGKKQPETVAVMYWSRKEHRFVLSASLHGGALVASYPFDTCDVKGEQKGCAAPDDPLPLHLASLYADNHPRMHYKFTGSEANEAFEGGVTQGAAWYPLLGGMQDWMWYMADTLEITVETHINKEPAPSLLPILWWENRASLLAFIRQAHVGIRGRVLDDETDHPLHIRVNVTKPANVRATTTDATGAFFKLLKPGTAYCLHVGNPETYHLHKIAVKLPAQLGLDSPLSSLYETAQVRLKLKKAEAKPEELLSVLGEGTAEDCD